MTRRLDSDPDLDGLIRQLNDSARAGDDDEPDERAEPDEGSENEPAATGRIEWRLPPADSGARDRLCQLLASCREIHSTDLALVSGAPPAARIDGDLRPLRSEPLSVAEIRSAIHPDPVAERSAEPG
jgi:hypothetical protein